MTFKKFSIVFTAIIMALLMSIASVSVMAAGDSIPKEPEPVPTDILDAEPTTAAPAQEVGTTAPASDEGVVIPDKPTKAVSEEEPAVDPEVLYGDVNLDGKVNINDVTALQSYFARKIDAPAGLTTHGDTNTDGKVNIYDATVIQLYLAGTFTELPVTPDGYYARLIRP